MFALFLADVNDGLCMAIETANFKTVLIDCGSMKGGKIAFLGLNKILNNFYSPHAFILSHFHIDHYNGILYASLNPGDLPYPLQINEVYYPRIPEFKEKEKFLCYLMAINLRVFGSETGVMEYDLLRALSRINIRSFKYKSVSKGDVLNIGGSRFEVLWPPRRIDSDGVISPIRRAITDFEKALEEDEETRMIYERVKDEGIFKVYFEPSGTITRKEYIEYEINENRLFQNYRKRKLPSVVINVNRSLREAANHLSLALFEDNRLLFFGDTEKFEIKRIIDCLKSNNRMFFYILITPHHGTHWENSMLNIKSIYSIISGSRRLSCRHLSLFNKISKIILATCINGDIFLTV